jgi:hypothetical protein
MSAKKTTPEFKEAFIDMLQQLPIITEVCKILQVSPSSVMDERDRDLEFDRRVKEAQGIGYGGLEAEALRRARDGVLEPVFHQGMEVGRVRKYSDKLLMFLLRGYKPARFNPGVKIDAGGTEKVTLNFNFGGENGDEE